MQSHSFIVLEISQWPHMLPHRLMRVYKCHTLKSEYECSPLSRVTAATRARDRLTLNSFHVVASIHVAASGQCTDYVSKCMMNFSLQNRILRTPLKSYAVHFKSSADNYFQYLIFILYGHLHFATKAILDLSRNNVFALSIVYEMH